MERAATATGLGVTPGFLQTLQAERGGEAARAGPRVQEQDLRQWGLTGQWLRANFRPAGQLAGTRLPRAGIPPHGRRWAPRVERPAGCFPADHRASLSRPCGGLGGEESRCSAVQHAGRAGSQSAIPGTRLWPRGEGAW